MMSTASWLPEYIFEAVVIPVIGLLATSQLSMNKQNKKRNEATQNGLKALLRNSIITAIHKCKKQGFCYIHEMDNINNMFREYSSLGGNGTITHLMSEVKELPIRTDLK